VENNVMMAAIANLGEATKAPSKALAGLTCAYPLRFYASRFVLYSPLYSLFLLSVGVLPAIGTLLLPFP
jgi:hypothetical protein